MLEICPTSNIMKKNVSELAIHPVNFFLHNNFNISVNTNNMTVENTTVTNEYMKLVETFGFTMDDFKKMNINAIESSFLSNEEKNRYKQYYM